MCAETQQGSQRSQGTQRVEDDDNTSSVSSWTTGASNFIYGRSCMTTHVVNNIKEETLIKRKNGQQDPEDDLREHILLDSGSSIDLFSNPNLVTNIRKSKQALFLSTNVGSKINKTQAKVPDYGTVWFDQDAIANIFALINLIKKYRVTFDSKKENAFLVYTPTGLMRFEGNKQGLHVFKPEYKIAESHVVATVTISGIG